ncbi:MAG TPA: YggS family pyridoxal phosphate-dependent enzyme [Thermoanaerobaculia bacterium]|nr:YggS family pyridoxal phosphate-dependent enzyme [Thermoanaerobaculia bacterium]
MLDADAIRANAAIVEAKIAAACARAGRNRDEVTLVAVTKTFPAIAIDRAVAAGITNVGENRVQEARDKQPETTANARWHLIGHLQSNKAKDAVKLFDVIQTIDSLDLAEKIAKAAGDKRIEVLLQVNIGRESQKSGIEVGDVATVAKQVATILDLRGLMAIPPHGDPEETRAYFRELKAMRDDLGLPELSMGMSEDYETAIEEGATIIRVGRAIFGERG